MNKIIEELVAKTESDLNYSFKNKNLLLEALTHPSYIVEQKLLNNERLEFLGDAVLNLIIAETLFHKHKDIREDKLSSIRAKLVSCDALCYVGNKIDLKNKILISLGEERNGGRDNLRNIENAFEAIIAAIFIDGGMESAKKFVSYHWNDLFDNHAILGIDSKSFLQEWAQKNKKIPVYQVLSSDGPSHAPKFEIMVSVEAVGSEKAFGNNKKDAEKKAAQNFINKFINNND